MINVSFKFIFQKLSISHLVIFFFLNALFLLQTFYFSKMLKSKISPKWSGRFGLHWHVWVNPEVGYSLLHALFQKQFRFIYP